MSGIWKLEQLKRWIEAKLGNEQGDEYDDGLDDDEQDDDLFDDGDEQDGDEGGEGGSGDEGEGSEQGEGEGEGDGEGDAEGGEADGDGKGGSTGEGGEGESNPEEGSNGRGKGGGKPLDPRDFANLDRLPKEALRDPNVTAKNVDGEASTPMGDEKQKPVIVLDPVEQPVGSVNGAQGTASVLEWNQKLKTIRVAALRLALRRLMQRSDFAGREGGLRSGRLSGRGVNRLLAGSENVFERRYEVEGENVAVSLLLDKSGSMSGPKMRQAADVALLIGETAQNAGAKLEVTAFSSAFDAEARNVLLGNLVEETGKDAYHAAKGDAWLYAEASAVYVIKAFTQTIGHLRRMYTTVAHMSSGGTHDASALKWAAARLLKQDANRKILFVIADGEGDNDAVFKHVVDEIEKQGVIVIGIGIGCDRTFTRRFTYATAINSPSDLCSKAFGMLIGTIAKAKGIA